MQSLIRRILHDNSAATAVEYGLILGLISVSVIFGLQGFSNQLVVLYQIVDCYTTNATSKN